VIGRIKQAAMAAVEVDLRKAVVPVPVQVQVPVPVLQNPVKNKLKKNLTKMIKRNKYLLDQ
jgi:hypothetical protein